MMLSVAMRFIFRVNNVGIDLNDVLRSDNGIESCIEHLKHFFAKKGRKNPYSDAHTYGRAVKLLKEYYIWMQIGFSQQPSNSSEISITYREKPNPNIPRPCNGEVESYIKRVTFEQSSRNEIDTNPQCLC